MLSAILPESSARMMERYDHFRKILCNYQLIIPESCDRGLVKKSAKALGIWRNGALVLKSGSDIAVVMDFALYGGFGTNGRTAVETYARRNPPRAASDEELVLDAMTRARYCLLQVTHAVPGVGAECFDLIRRERLFLANRGLGNSMSSGMTLASRLVSMPGFEMSTGGDLPVDPESYFVLTKELNRLMRKYNASLDAFDHPVVMNAVSALIAGLCLDAGCGQNIQRIGDEEYINEFMESIKHESRALTEQNVSRNRPCPCGSGSKYKRCCGKLARR